MVSKMYISDWCDMCKNYRSDICCTCTKVTLSNVGKIDKPYMFEEAISYNRVFYRVNEFDKEFDEAYGTDVFGDILMMIECNHIVCVNNDDCFKCPCSECCEYICRIDAAIQMHTLTIDDDEYKKVKFGPLREWYNKRWKEFKKVR